MPAGVQSAGPTLAIRRATLSDLRDIVIIEHDSFPSPWPAWSLRQEMSRRDSIFLVAVSGGRVVGYIGMHAAAGLGHVGTVAVGSAHRQRGIGEALMLAALQLGIEAGLESVVLEYRVSNTRAGNLYQKLGFVPTRIRRGYYSDTQEDAVETLLSGLQEPAVQEQLTSLRLIWQSKHGQPLPRPQD